MEHLSTYTLHLQRKSVAWVHLQTLASRDNLNTPEFWNLWIVSRAFPWNYAFSEWDKTGILPVRYNAAKAAELLCNGIPTASHSQSVGKGNIISWRRFRTRNMFLSPVISHSAKQDVTCSWVYELFTSWTAMGSFIYAELSLVKFLLDENGAVRLALTMALMSVSGAMSALVGVKLRAPSWKHRALYWGLGVGRNTQKVLGRWSFVKPTGSWIRDAGQWGEKQWVTILLPGDTCSM